jgi:hypothetical protein
MTLYSDLPARRLIQIVADLGMILWVVVWIRIGAGVRDATLQLAEPGRRLARAGDGFRGTMTRAGDSVRDLPVLNDRISTPFRSAAGLGTDLESTGRDLVTSVERVALLLGVTTALAPIVLLGGVWLARRWRFARRAGAARRFIDADPDLDLFALRAMAGQPMPRLAAVSHDPAGAWRRGEADVIRALAVLELRDVGLRAPSSAGSSD